MLSLSLLVNCGGGKDTQTKTDKSHEGHVHFTDPADKMTAGEGRVYYTCPMDAYSAEYSSDPGHCPKCGIDLVAGVITVDDHSDFYGCPILIHSHICEENPRTCADFGMKLKPMRLLN